MTHMIYLSKELLQPAGGTKVLTEEKDDYE